MAAFERRHDVESGSYPSEHYAWVVLTGCTMLSILSGVFFYSRGVFLPQIAHDLGVGRLRLSLAFTGAQVIGALAAPIVGAILDRYSPRVVLAIGAVMLSAAYLLTALSHDLYVIYAIFGLLAGIGWITISNFGSARILVEWFDRRLGFALSVDGLGASLAGVVVAPIATLLIAQSGWRLAYAEIGVATLAIALPVLAFVIRSRPASEVRRDDTHAAAPSWTLRQALSDPAFWGVAVVFGLMACVWSGINLHLFGHLSDRGLSPLAAARVLSVEAAAAAIGKPAIGWLSDAIGVLKTTLLTALLQLAGVVSFAMATTEGSALVSALIYGLGLSGLVGLPGLAVARAFGRPSYGLVSGWLRTATLPFTLVGSPLAGFVYDRFGTYQPAFWCYAIMLLLILPALKLLHLEQRVRSNPDVVAA